MLKEISLLKCLCTTLAIIIYKFRNDRDLYCYLHTERRKRRRKRRRKKRINIKINNISLYKDKRENEMRNL